MIRFHFVLAATVVLAGAAFAQHSSAGSGSSGGSSGGSSAGSSGGSYSGGSYSGGGGYSGGGSHGGYSGGSSSSGGSSGGGHSSSGGYSGGGHSSGGSSGGGHSSGSGSHGSGGGSSVGSGSRGYGSGGHFPGGGPSAPHYGLLNPHSQNPHVVQEWRGGLQLKTSHPEKRGFLSFLRHPFHQSPPVSDLRHRICVKGTCAVCPAGSSLGKNGVCTSSNIAQNMCLGGSYWNGESCEVLGAQVRCAYIYDAGLIAARRAMEEAEKQRNLACSRARASQQCAELEEQYQRMAELYRRQAMKHTQGFQHCVIGSAFGSFDAID